MAAANVAMNFRSISSGITWILTMRLSDAGLRRRNTKLIYPNHRPPPWLTEDAPRDRSNRLLDYLATPAPKLPLNSADELTPELDAAQRPQGLELLRPGAQRRLLNTA